MCDNTLSVALGSFKNSIKVQARTISDVQWKLLSQAHIEDADPRLLEWQQQLRLLTPGGFTGLVEAWAAEHPEQAFELAMLDWDGGTSGPVSLRDSQRPTGRSVTGVPRQLRGPA